ncbi:NADP-dependent oxidoreductase [Streptomyces sp. NBC_01445]|uniref:NADP-dependent oxidoreductase n=1 Tax=Streptomyces sp. NBC_01445 TaxID=2903869 RepID=UPI002DDC1DB9|nr:NADP-dependent oxidoreductase [Streptomyces sp. NBC_01445]WSE05941.1 NADP-dependent oxidoreductase [Streptomyces sp. NBC_01445]
MEAIVFEEFGGPEVLRFKGDIEEPHAGPGQVRVKVAAVGVNPIEYKIRNGWMEQAFPTSLPAVPGNEFAGTVDELGEGVTGLSVGDEVLGWSETGAYAAYALAQASAVTPRPTGLEPAAAATLPIAGETAQRVLDLLGVRSGETLLIHGAAGAVGSMGVQLAVALGATVIGTASPANHEYLRSIGAVPVAYGDGLVERVRAVAPQGVDAVFDAAGKGALADSVELRGGTPDRVVTIADPDAAKYDVTFASGGTDRAKAREGLTHQAALAADGKLHISIAGTFPLRDAAKAQTLSETGHVRGKLVLLVG